MPPRVEETDPEGVDYGRVMQLTFVATLALGVPLVAALSVPLDLPTWTARARFAMGVGAVVWIVTALGVFWIERRRAQARAEGNGVTSPEGDETGSPED